MGLYDTLPKPVKERIRLKYKLLERKVRLFYLRHKLKWGVKRGYVESRIRESRVKVC